MISPLEGFPKRRNAGIFQISNPGGSKFEPPGIPGIRQISFGIRMQ